MIRLRKLMLPNKWKSAVCLLACALLLFQTGFPGPVISAQEMQAAPQEGMPMPTPEQLEGAGTASPGIPFPKPQGGAPASPGMPMPQTIPPKPGAVPMVPPEGAAPEQQPTAPAQPAAPRQEPAMQPLPAAPATTPSAPPSPRTQRTMTSGGGSSFFFDDADVFEVIQTVFGDVLRVNYIIDPQVKGRVNFRTNTPIPRDKILPIMEIILRLNGVAVIEESSLYRIIPIGNIAKEPAPIRFGKDPNAVELKGTSLIQVVPLSYINSSEMMSVITPLLTQGGAVYDISKRNMLMIADTDANIRRLLQVIQMFDETSYKSASQPKIYVYPLQNSKADHVSKILQQVLLGQAVSTGTGVRSAGASGTAAGAARPTTPGMTQPQQTTQPSLPASFQSAGGESVVASGTKVYPDDVTNSLVIYASPGDYALILAAVKQLDTIPRQVMLEAIVASVQLTDNMSFGVKWNLNTDLKLSPFKNDVNIGGPLGFQPLLSPVPTNSFGYTAFDSNGKVRLAIEALAEAGKGKILSSPHILVADNREARIQVGTQIPIATSTTTTPTGTGTGTVNTTSSSIQYKDTGTILKVKPQVNDSGVVSLEITQEVSSANTQSVLGTDQFVISKSEVTTNLIAQDGQTIVIGGLISETVSFTRSGIPILSSIPVLGYLFGQTKDDTQRQELIILLTPKVVRNQAEAARVTSDYYDLFKNLDKEINIQRIRKRLPAAEESLQVPPPAQQTPESKTLPGSSSPLPESSNKNHVKPVPSQQMPAPNMQKNEPVQNSPILHEQGNKKHFAGGPARNSGNRQAESARADTASNPAFAALGTSASNDTVHPSMYHARICSFRTEPPAENLRASVEKKLGATHPVTLLKDGEFYTVRVHGFSSVDSLKETMQKLRIRDFRIGKTVENTQHALAMQ